MKMYSNHGHETDRLDASHRLASGLAEVTADDSGGELGKLADSVSGFARQLSVMAGDIRVAETLVTASLIEIGSANGPDHSRSGRPQAARSAPQDLDTVVSVLGEIVARTTQLAHRANIAAIHTLVQE
jgi:methyl-accepting chemotaxis protein